MRNRSSSFFQKLVSMREYFIPIVVFLVIMGFAPAFAQTGGFTGPGPGAVSVEQAKNMKDDAKVTLEGQIIQSLGGKHYLLRDSTGVITVEIDRKIWAGQSVGPDDTVVVDGEVDKDWSKVTIEVKKLIKK